MASYAKAKGKNFEREFAAHLSNVFGLSFMRIPNSGAFTGGKNFFRKALLSKSQNLLMTGDLIMPDELHNISVECKFYAKFSFVTLFSSNKQLDGWIAQAETANKLWFLPFKVNNCGVHVVYDPALAQLSIPGNYMKYSKYIIVPLDGFFESNKEFLLNYCKKSDTLESETSSVAVQTT